MTKFERWFDAEIGRDWEQLSPMELARMSWDAALSQPHASAQEAAPEPKPALYIARAKCDSERTVEGELSLEDVSEKPFKVADPEVWECAPLYFHAPAPVQEVASEIRSAAREANMASDYASQKTLADWASRLASPSAPVQAAPTKPQNCPSCDVPDGCLPCCEDCPQHDRIAAQTWKPVSLRDRWIAAGKPDTPAPVAADTLTEEAVIQWLDKTGRISVSREAYLNALAASPARAIPAQGAAPVPAEPVAWTVRRNEAEDDDEMPRYGLGWDVLHPDGQWKTCISPDPEGARSHMQMLHEKGRAEAARLLPAEQAKERP